jgi:KDO2-lipid IV(A) lauroyltransferase
VKAALTWIPVGLLWLLHWLPLPVLRAVGWALGRMLYALGRERRNVALINLRLCFPDKTEAERERLARDHVVAFCRSVIDRTLFWWASAARLRRLVRVSGMEHFTAAGEQPVILLCPHFVGLDAVATRLSMDILACSVYSSQNNPVLNRLLLHGRLRFNPGAVLMSRQDGMRKIVKALKDGYPFFYLPDQDFGPKESIFVPFFGVPAATIPALSRLVRLTGAVVVPTIVFQRPDGYDIEVQQPLAGFPGESLEADTAFMNRFIESQVLRMPEQYFWLHKRFKTRPPGEQRFYK